jgi:hypothetical protein
VKTCIRLLKNCSAPIKVTSELTKVPYSTVQLILSSENIERKKRDVQKFTRISETLGTEIKQVIYNMYKDNQVPTIASPKSKLISLGFDINYCNESFRLYLRSIGFLYKTLNQRICIMESPRLKKLRWDYITKIRKYREGRYIVWTTVSSTTDTWIILPSSPGKFNPTLQFDHARGGS